VHYAAGLLVLTSVLVLLLMWGRRTAVLDLWLIVTICMMISEMALVTFGLTARFYLGWYVSRTLAVAISMVVMIALLAEAMRSHVEVLKANILLRRERDHTKLLIFGTRPPGQKRSRVGFCNRHSHARIESNHE